MHDKDLGFVRFGWRDYDTFTGRWTAPDPMGDGGGDHDWYGYCLDDPVNSIDPTGLVGWDFGGDSGRSFPGGGGGGSHGNDGAKNNGNKDDSGRGNGGWGFGKGEGGRSFPGGLGPSRDTPGSGEGSGDSSKSGGYRGNDFGPGYNGRSGSAYGPTPNGWGYKKDNPNDDVSSTGSSRNSAQDVVNLKKEQRRAVLRQKGVNIITAGLMGGLIGAAKWGYGGGMVAGPYGALAGGVLGFGSGLLGGTIGQGIWDSDLPDTAKNWGSAINSAIF